MIHRIPSGTRDVLPDETREVHVITEALRGVFERHGYGEVSTPALEYEAVLARADMAEARPAYRVFDESGAVLVLRSDMTVPIARVVATRYPTVEPPIRFCYVAHCYRGVRPQRGQPRELLQAGIELIGAPAPQGTAEALSVLCDALDAVGLKGYRVGLGDASLFPALMASLHVPEEDRAELLATLARRDFVELESRLAAAGLADDAAELLLSLPQRRGGPEVLADAPLRLCSVAQHRLLHGRRLRGVRPGAGRPARRRRALRRAAGALRALAPRRGVRAGNRPPAHRPRRRGAGHGGAGAMRFAAQPRTGGRAARVPRSGSRTR
jgi:ATP phosphoribosyltransferase regulatory subunit HisZ